MSFKAINFWIEGDISTTRIISRFLGDMVGTEDCHTRQLGSINWRTLVKGLNIFCRSCDPRYVWVPDYLKKNGVPYIYYLDDNFWKITGTSELARYYQSADVVASLDAFVQGAEFIITHSQMLADFIARRFPAVKCELLPVPFDVELVESIEVPTFEPSVGAAVGYAGGYKKEEFELLEDVVEQMGKDRPDVRFEFIGGVSDKLREMNNVQWFPGSSDYATFLELKVSRGWTVGLAPLMESVFNASKTNNKFREYGGCKIPAVYSNTNPFIGSVQHEISGLLVANKPGDWVAAIKKLIDNKPLHEKISNEAFKFVKATYSHEAIIPAWRESFEGLVSNIPYDSSTAFRFYYVKQYYVHNFYHAKKSLATAPVVPMLVMIFFRKFKSLLRRLNMRRFLVLVVLIAVFSIYKS